MCQVVGNIYSGYYYGWLNDQFTQGDSYPYHGYLLWGSTTCLSSYNVCTDAVPNRPWLTPHSGRVLRHDVQQLLLPLLPLRHRRGARAASAAPSNALPCFYRNLRNFLVKMQMHL